MSDPLIDPADLGVYLNDPSIDFVRASDLIVDAQTLCESVVTPLPAGADVVVKRIAGRAYVTVTSARQMQLAQANGAMGAVAGGMGGVWLSRADIADLRRLAGRGGAFSISMLPACYELELPPWDVNGRWIP